ncbi:hypothetical protein GX50_05739 [[Emmonsia] crescens]|uniref:Uncharacterized protein n=1 Tax=[Emmonsia] crescens TaxID=73230 RepID=A0A2B7ZFB8_9EURO|nr:hypothetical protein GX50_05739 [Emmonsia crescens]
MKVDRSELFLSRNEHVRNAHNKSHEPFAAYLDAICPECDEDGGPDHDYFLHRITYQGKMRGILPCILVDCAVPCFSHCFDIEWDFRTTLDSTSSPQEDLVLYDLAECLHKRLIFMENELRRLSQEDYLDIAFGGPIRSLKDIRLLLREILSLPDPPLPCPAPGCRRHFLA